MAVAPADARRSTACRICAVGCGTIVAVAVESGAARVVRVVGDPDDPVSQGYTCARSPAVDPV